MTLVLIGLGILALFAGLLLIPLGLPGLWIMVGVLALAALGGEAGWAVPLLAAAVAGAAELVEFVLVSRLTVRYGGSRAAFWGAIAGGLAGVVVGLPVPIVGPVIAGIVGSFLGAMAAALLQTRELRASARVGWGALLGRVFAAAAKTAAGVVILVLGVGALLAR